MKIYTKTGDQGKTSLYDNTRVYKDDIRVESYGTIDELESWLGLCKSHVNDSNLKSLIEHIQNKLFVVSSNLATKDTSKIKYHLTNNDVLDLENLIDEFTLKLGTLQGFIVTGNTKEAAFFHVARTVCRRAERRMITLAKQEAIDNLLIQYVNRLGDLLYIWARYLENDAKKVTY